MNLRINHILNNSLQSLSQRIVSPPTFQQQTVIVIAFFALACLAALYYVTRPKKTIAATVGTQNKVNQTPSTPGAKAAQTTQNDIKHPTGTPITEDDAEAFEHALDADDADDAVDTDVAPKPKPPQPPVRKGTQKGNAQPDSDKDADQLLDADTELAIKLSLEQQNPKQKKTVSDEEDSALQAGIAASLDQTSGKSDDADLAAVKRKTKEEADAKEKEDIKKAMDASKKDAPKAAPLKPTPKVTATSKKAGTPADKTLLDTTKANSDKSSNTIEIAVDNAKKNTKIKISSFEVKRNDVDNSFLTLHFDTTTACTRAIEEMRSNDLIKMFKGSYDPKRLNDGKSLELTVEETIEFQTKF